MPPSELGDSSLATSADNNIDGYDSMSWGESYKCMRDFMDKIIKGEIHKPSWMHQAEESFNDGWGCRRSTSLHLIPKDDKYNKIGEAIIKLVRSIDAEECMD